MICLLVKASGREGKEDDKPCVTSMKTIPFGNIQHQTSPSFKQISSQKTRKTPMLREDTTKQSACPFCFTQMFWRLLTLSAFLLRKLNTYYYLCNALGTECQETYFPSTFSLSKRSSLGTSCYLCRTVLNWVLLILGRILCKCKRCTVVCCYCRIHSVVWRSKCFLWCPFVRLPWGS